MGGLKYSHLFEPIQLGNQLFKHRIFSSPQDIYRLTYEGFLDTEGTAFYERKALGGYASVCLGDFFVDSSHGMSHKFQMVGDDVMGRGSYTRTANAIKRHGAVATVELNHAGRMAMPYKDEDFVWGVSEDMRPDGIRVREMDEAWIERLIKCYADAATFTVQSGFNMIMIHAGHGWLPAQFFSPAVNKRKDRWGGSLENRLRFPLAIVQAVRERVGRVPIEVRISGAENYEGGYTDEEGIEFAKALDGIVDLIHVSTGHHEHQEASMHTHPPMFSPDGVNVHYAAEIKKYVKQSAVATVGALTNPDIMEEIIATGKADVVQCGRETLADPDLPIKARIGREDEINECLRCMACFSGSTASGIFYCATNPEIGHEFDTLNDCAPKIKKKVLVAGGGIGGMQAALTAADRGHEVVLCEKTGRLGGTLLCEEKVSFKSKLDKYIKKQALLISRAGIDLRLNTEVTPALADEIGADVIIAALGARPVKPPVPGIDKDFVYGAEAVYEDPSLAGDNVVIMGGGLVGLELAIWLAQMGKKITVLEMLPYTIMSLADMDTSDLINNPQLIAPGTNVVHGIALAQQVRALENLDVITSAKVLEIKDDGTVVTDKESYKADTVVYAAGQKPLTEEAKALNECAPEFYQIGDCVTPANIMQATQAAYQIARDIGRY
jgi:2,4-dienoyl-CoA reductase-like NADH-dependent reductase (Old Yellow Enzyme family)/thioredoxin reductase